MGEGSKDFFGAKASISTARGSRALVSEQERRSAAYNGHTQGSGRHPYQAFRAARAPLRSATEEQRVSAFEKETRVSVGLSAVTT